MQNSLANRQNNGVTTNQTFSSYVNSKTGQAIINNLFADQKQRNRFATAVITIVANGSKELKSCDFGTIVSAAAKSEAMGLPLNEQLGFVYLVPFKDGKTGRMVCTFQVGWKGIIQLMIKSNVIKKVHAVEVKQGELIKYNPITNDFEFSYLVNPQERLKAKTMGYYAFFETTNGYVQEMFWTKEQMEEHAITYSQSYRTDKQKGWNYSYWTKNFDAMAKKTMLKQLAKFAPMSIELLNAINADNTYTDEKGEVVYIDNQEDDFETNVEETTPVEEVKADPVVEKQPVQEVKQEAPKKKTIEDYVRETSPEEAPLPNEVPGGLFDNF